MSQSGNFSMAGTLPPDTSIGYQLITTRAVFLAVATGILGLRLYVRKVMVRSVGLEDWLMVASWLLSIVLLALTIPEVQFGAGRHTIYVPPEHQIESEKYLQIGIPINALSTTLARVSIGVFLLRLLAVNKWWKNGLLCFIILITASNVIYFVFFFFTCIPVSSIWNPNVEGWCMDYDIPHKYSYYVAVLNIFADFFLALLPIYLLRGVCINKIRKICVCILMGLGVVTGVFAVVRAILQVYWTSEATQLREVPDITRKLVPLLAIAAVEEYLLIICGSIPPASPFFNPEKRSRRGCGGPWSTPGVRVGSESSTHNLKGSSMSQV